MTRAGSQRHSKKDKINACRKEICLLLSSLAVTADKTELICFLLETVSGLSYASPVGLIWHNLFSKR